MMTTKDSLTRGDILDAVRFWPAKEQSSLAYDNLMRVERDRVSPEERRAALRRLKGIAATDAPPPTDEEVQQILEEELLNKYG